MSDSKNSTFTFALEERLSLGVLQHPNNDVMHQVEKSRLLLVLNE